MFDTSDKIAAVVDLLEARQAPVWHSCQLKDFPSYLRIGGVPSRQALERSRLPFTSFVSDAQDRMNGVWGSVIFNLEDLGRAFAQGFRAMPAIYGPIALQFSPRVLLRADSVAVCLGSADAKGFDRSSQSLGSPDEVDRLYRNPAGAGFPFSTFVKRPDELQDAFPAIKKPRRAEVSCTFSGPGPSHGRSSFDGLVAIWVDPINVGGKRLLAEVQDASAKSGFNVPVHERPIQNDRRVVQHDIGEQLSNGYVPLNLLAGRHGVAPETREWVAAMLAVELGWLWNRYARYLIEGTLEPMTGTARRPTSITSPRPSGPAPVHIAEVLNRFKEQ